VDHSNLVELLLGAVQVSGPTFAWVILGVSLRRLDILNTTVINRVTRFSFLVALPFVLFVGAAQVDYGGLANATYLLAAITSTLLTLALSWLYGRWRQYPRRHLGIFIQGAFRSNLAVVGVALCISAYGDTGLALAALPVAVMTVLYNILAVWVLDSTLGNHSSVVTIAVGMIKNPLIIGIAAGSLISVAGIVLPSQALLLSSGISTWFIPVLLVCIGGSIRLSGLTAMGALTWEACAWRLLVSPFLAVGTALLLGVSGDALGVLFLLLASPAAAASFVMVVAARGDGALAANIIVLTTLFSLLTVTAGFFLLSLGGLV